MAKLNALISKYKGDLSRVHKDSCLLLNNRITESTPRKDGGARRSWSPEGSLVIGKDYKFSSNLDYIHALEYGRPGFVYKDGREAHSSLAPCGMLRINLRNWAAIVKEQL